MAQDIFHDIGKRLFEYLKENPMSASQLSRKVGVGYNTLLRIIRGQSTFISLEVLAKIEKFLDTVAKEKNSVSSIE